MRAVENIREDAEGVLRGVYDVTGPIPEGESLGKLLAQDCLDLLAQIDAIANEALEKVVRSHELYDRANTRYVEVNDLGMRAARLVAEMVHVAAGRLTSTDFAELNEVLVEARKRGWVEVNVVPKTYFSGTIKLNYGEKRHGVWIECEVTSPPSRKGATVHVYLDESACLELFKELRKHQAWERA